MVGIAYSKNVSPTRFIKSYYKSDYQRFQAVLHASNFSIDDCVYCQELCDEGLLICCDGCGKIHHSDWIGWFGSVKKDGKCIVLCGECEEKQC